MSEETTTSTTEAAEAAETSTETTAPELTDEQIAAHLGVDPAYFAEVKGNIQNLDKFYAKVNKRNMDLIEAQKQVAQAPIASDDDDDIDLDESSQKVLRKFLARELAPFLNTVQATTYDAMQDTALEFAAGHTDVPPAAVDAAMEEIGGWNASTPAQLKRNLERAYKLAKADTSDIDAVVEAKLAERLAAVKGDGEEIVEVKPKRGTVTSPRSEAEILADPNISPQEKWKMLATK